MNISPHGHTATGRSSQTKRLLRAAPGAAGFSCARPVPPGRRNRPATRENPPFHPACPADITDSPFPRRKTLRFCCYHDGRVRHLTTSRFPKHRSLYHEKTDPHHHPVSDDSRPCLGWHRTLQRHENRNHLPPQQGQKR